MDEKAPITWLIAEISSIVSGGASTVAGGISTAIAPLASVGFGIYIILICINYLRGAETEPVIDFGMRCVGFAETGEATCPYCGTKYVFTGEAPKGHH